MIVTVLVITTACGAAHITRINGEGVIVAGPKYIDLVTYTDPRVFSEVSEAGYVYVSDSCYSHDLEYIASYDGYTRLVLDNNSESTFFYINEYKDEQHYIEVRTLIFDLKFSYLIPIRPRSITVDENDGSIWFSTLLGEPFGLYKYSYGGDPIYYFPEYNSQDILSPVASDGTFWCFHPRNEPDGASRFGPNGDILVDESRTYPPSYYLYKNDASFWTVDRWGPTVLYKIDSFGSIVLRLIRYGDIEEMGVDQNDGSLWLTTGDDYVVHLDINGNEIRRIKWFEGTVGGIAPDPSDDTVIVISGIEYHGGSVQPSSLGRIKAEFK